MFIRQWDPLLVLHFAQKFGICVSMILLNYKTCKIEQLQRFESKYESSERACSMEILYVDMYQGSATVDSLGHISVYMVSHSDKTIEYFNSDTKRLTCYKSVVPFLQKLYKGYKMVKEERSCPQVKTNDSLCYLWFFLYILTRFSCPKMTSKDIHSYFNLLSLQETQDLMNSFSLWLLFYCKQHQQIGYNAYLMKIFRGTINGKVPETSFSVSFLTQIAQLSVEAATAESLSDIKRFYKSLEKVWTPLMQHQGQAFKFSNLLQEASIHKSNIQKDIAMFEKYFSIWYSGINGSVTPLL
jgi:hypothetical protein